MNFLLQLSKLADCFRNSALHYNIAVQSLLMSYQVLLAPHAECLDLFMDYSLSHNFAPKILWITRFFKPPMQNLLIYSWFVHSPTTSPQRIYGCLILFSAIHAAFINFFMCSSASFEICKLIIRVFEPPMQN